MRHLEPILQQHGGRLAFVGHGSIDDARQFVAQHVGEHALLVDAERRAFAAAGMRRSRLLLVSPRMWRNALRARREGFRQEGLQGDAWQLGGVVVLGPDGRSAWRQVERTAGDELDLRRVAELVQQHGPRR
ncbi:MAG: AhpC/TSA family protein [Planctomycetes bacterium]|nr:AhpC/TSA family protein [Planctomycetota bacterium]